MGDDRNFADGLEDYAGHEEYRKAAADKARREEQEREEQREAMEMHSSDRGDKWPGIFRC